MQIHPRLVILATVLYVSPAAASDFVIIERRDNPSPAVLLSRKLGRVVSMNDIRDGLDDAARRLARLRLEHAGLVQTTRRLERQLFANHLTSECHDALRQRVAVRDDDDPDHGPLQSP